MRVVCEFGPILNIYWINIYCKYIFHSVVSTQIVYKEAVIENIFTGCGLLLVVIITSITPLSGYKERAGCQDQNRSIK